MAKTSLNVRLIDKNNILHPETMVDNLVKAITVADDGTVSTVKFVPVEHRNVTNRETYAYVATSTGDQILKVSSGNTAAALATSIAKYTANGALNVITDASNTVSAINIDYANKNYGSLLNYNSWKGIQQFERDIAVLGSFQLKAVISDELNLISVGANRIINMSKTPSGSTTPSSHCAITIPYADGTLALVSEVTGGDSSTLASAKAYTDTQIAANISSVLKYKGSVKTYADLPKTGNKIGDTWNVEAGYGEAHAGTNWAWNGTTWDPLGGTIDTSVFVKRTELGTGGDLDLTKKLDKQTTTGYFAYTHNGTTQNEIKISNAAEVNTLVSRDSAGEAYGVGMLVTGAMTDTADGSDTTLGTIGFASSSLALDALASASDIKRIVLAASNSLQNEHITLSNNILIETGKKVDKKTTSGNWIYSHTSATQNEIGYGTSATGSTIVQRTPDGGIILPDYDLTTLPPSSAAINHGYVIKLLASYSRITYEEI